MMRAWLLWLLAYTFVGPLGPAHGQSTFDGDFWQAKVRDLKLIYVVGFFDGRNSGVNEAARNLGTTVLDQRLKGLASRVTVGQIVDGLDEFYKDWRNRRIFIRDAIPFVIAQAEGKDDPQELLMLRRGAASREKAILLRPRDRTGPMHDGRRVHEFAWPAPQLDRRETAALWKRDQDRSHD